MPRPPCRVDLSSPSVVPSWVTRRWRCSRPQHWHFVYELLPLYIISTYELLAVGKILFLRIVFAMVITWTILVKRKFFFGKDLDNAPVLESDQSNYEFAEPIAKCCCDPRWNRPLASHPDPSPSTILKEGQTLPSWSQVFEGNNLWARWNRFRSNDRQSRWTRKVPSTCLEIMSHKLPFLTIE